MTASRFPRWQRQIKAGDMVAPHERSVNIDAVPGNT